jgi:hypothetical protein
MTAAYVISTAIIAFALGFEYGRLAAFRAIGKLLKEQRQISAVVSPAAEVGPHA